MTKKEEKVIDVFFDASSSAALVAYQKHGKIPMSLSALVKNGKDYEAIPLGDDSLHNVDARLAQPVIDAIVSPLVKHINTHKGAYPVMFFLSVAAHGGLRDLDTGDIEEADIIINSARTAYNKGKTNTFKIKDGSYTKIYQPKLDAWTSEKDDDDISAVLLQGLLDMVWKSYVVEKNMSTLKST